MHNFAIPRFRSLLERVSTAVGSVVVNQAQATLRRLCRLAPDRSLWDLHLLLPFGGGKDSAWVLAYVRLMQFLLRQEHGCSFKLDVYLMIHPGVPRGVFENINAVLGVLEFEGDDEVDVIATTRGGEPIDLVEGRISSSVVEGFRKEVLISGHLSRCNGRETFCNTCNLALMSELVRFVVGRNGAVDVVVTGDSMREAASYWRWIQKACRRFMLPRVPPAQANWGTLFSQISKINDAYYTGLYGQAPEMFSHEGFIDIIGTGIRTPSYFSLFEKTQYEYHNHQNFIEYFLRFRLRGTPLTLRNLIVATHC